MHLAVKQILVALWNRKNVVIYDHRNLLAIIAAFTCKIFPSRFGFIFIGEDGLHSLMVDKYKKKFLFWQTSPVKEFLLKRVGDQVLSFKRLHAIKDMRTYTVPGSIFMDFYGYYGGECKKTTTSVLFIDAPAVMDCMNSCEIKDLSALLKTYTNVEIILHPRRKDHSFYDDLGFSCRYSSNVEEELSISIKKIEVVSFFSTVLLASKYYNHKIKVLDMPSATKNEFKEYANYGLKIINNLE